MSKIVEISSISDYCSAFDMPVLHPLVSVLDLSKGKWKPKNKTEQVRYHFYGVFLKQGKSCVMQYGRQTYDYEDGTLVFVGPGQIVNIAHVDDDFQPSGYALLFHPDFLGRTPLGKDIDKYNFFTYQLHEALHLSAKERQIVLDCFDKIHFELSQGIDNHSKQLIISNLYLFLNYCVRFYDRQFITRDTANLGVVENFESSLNAFMKSGRAREEGTPQVSYFAAEQHLSSNYFGDLIKKETGKSAQEHIQAKLIDVAKGKIFDPEVSLAEIAYDLGFKHPQHFTRFFKNRVGYSPKEFRSLN